MPVLLQLVHCCALFYMAFVCLIQFFLHLSRRFSSVHSLPKTTTWNDTQTHTDTSSQTHSHRSTTQIITVMKQITGKNEYELSYCFMATRNQLQATLIEAGESKKTPSSGSKIYYIPRKNEWRSEKTKNKKWKQKNRAKKTIIMPTPSSHFEGQTEDDLLWKMTCSLRRVVDVLHPLMSSLSLFTHPLLFLLPSSSHFFLPLLLLHF